MRFVLFRHAHKGILPFEDPELSSSGFEQAARILSLVQENTLMQPTQLLASPKRRTSQTFYPMSKYFNLKIEIQEELDQQNQLENNTEFRNRVQKFLQLIQNQQSKNLTIFACTHFDWIEEAMSLISSDKDLNSFVFSNWSPAQYVEFEIHENLWKFIQKGQAK